MLILVAVTISMAVNGGLFDYAGRATGETQNAIEQEGDLANGKVTVDNKVYSSIDDYLAGKYEGYVPTYGEAKFENGILTENATYTSGEYTAVIPKGFKIIPGTNNTTTIEDGLVIQDENGNEFIWIPVEKAIVTEAEITKIKEEDNTITTDLEAVQKMVNSGTYPMAVQVGENYKGILYDFSGTDTLTATVYDWTSSVYREPANNSGDNTTNLDTWTETLYQNSFNSMVKSVADNGGFYVGRYEMSSGTYTLDNGNTVTYAQSKSNQSDLANGMWYSMYEYGRDYAACNSNLGVISEMIWGSQWGQMMFFVNGKNDGAESPAPFYVTTSGSRKSGSSFTKTGMNTVDQVANIFDLEASAAELTQETCMQSGWRVYRGGDWDYDYPASSRYFRSAPGFGCTRAISSRASLYLK